MPSVISETAELSESRLGDQALVEGLQWCAPFYSGLTHKLIATVSGGSVQFGRRQLPSGLTQHNQREVQA